MLMPAGSANAIAPIAATPTPTWPAVPASLQPTASSGASANMLSGLSTSHDPTSPTGGIANFAAQPALAATQAPLPTTNNVPAPAPTPGPQSGNVSAGIDTSSQGLLPGGFSQASLGVSQQNQTPAPAQSYVQQGAADQQNPTNWTVTPDQTVQGQYASLMSKGNMAIQDTEQQTLRSYAAAGGGNNLMAQNAATLAGSKVALTIAAQDAATYAAAGQFNASAANTFKAQLNQFTDNALLSRQNFDQGVAMLGAQTNQQLTLLAANVNATAATTSIQLKATLAQTQANLSATMTTMAKQYWQATGLAQTNASIADEQSWQKYGQQVTLGYLSSVSQQQAALQSTIGAIQSNPNISNAQATGAVSDAVNEFNTFVSQMGAYSAAAMPKAGAAGTGTAPTYTTPGYTYNYIAPGFPNPPATPAAIAPAAAPATAPAPAPAPPKSQGTVITHTPASSNNNTRALTQ